MKRRYLQLSTLLPASLPLALLTPSLAAEQVTVEELSPFIARYSSVEVGLGHVSDSGTRLGRFSGLGDDGFFAVLGLDWIQAAEFDSDRPVTIRLRAEDLGLDVRTVRLDYRQHGAFGVYAEYDERSARFIDDAVTVYREPAQGQRNLPADWVAATSTAGMNVLLPSLGEFDVSSDRRSVAAGGDARFAERWQISTDFRQEDRDGHRAMAAMFGPTGGTPRAAFLPVPTDYRTREVDLALNYADRQRQFRVRYHASLFDNNQPNLIFANPFAAIGGWHPSAGYPDGAGQMALPPDNTFHQIGIGGSHLFSPRLTFSGEAAFGQMRQDDDFLNYTINPALIESIVQGLPRASLDGRIDTTAINLRLAGRPNQRFNWTASYRLDDRDNRTPMGEFVYIGSDSQLQDAGETSSRRRYNLPYDYRDQRLRLAGNWRLAQSTRLQGVAEHRRIDRSFTARERTDEDRLELGFRHAFGQRLTAGINLEWADRSGSTYDGAVGFRAGHSEAYVDTVPGGWGELPALRLYHLADRRRQGVNVNAAITPNDDWSITLQGGTSKDDFHRSEIGLVEAGNDLFAADVSYSPSRHWSAHAFITHERIRSDQDGFSFRGGGFRADDLASPDRWWQARHRDRVDTLGLGMSRLLMNERLELRADYVHADARAGIDVQSGPALDTEPLPDLTSRRHTLNLAARYQINEQLSLRARWWFERYQSADWALDDVGPNQLADIILPGETSYNDRVNVLMLSLIHRWQ
ncbi:MtrB/PioB family decaheme-associated outer membrane protein [Wenzhouxiangella sp. AB-CW3]|uniref:MtrB/PioB family decaheme-associated outer membrane protein n=1 Tax=Wenzhouxiangella sp. AB-CW3 TaxID=2771012 RepID=UPI00168B8DED|nr:MtrB/PioB family decaheme-associated outer membrane protein [Wenzhouxiangella sp. AB-CW3]QOC23920.1 MtrB/PioB family decaheme-associated outer membrane protein [Wenzhouxiangella sp. AB-CW3]